MEKCSWCPEPAMCEYRWGDDPQRYACAAHDPLMPAGIPVTVIPENLRWATLFPFPVPPQRGAA